MANNTPTRIHYCTQHRCFYWVKCPTCTPIHAPHGTGWWLSDEDRTFLRVQGIKAE